MANFDEQLWRWRSESGARAAFTGVSVGNLGDHVGDDPKVVRERREEIAKVLGVGVNDIACVNQVHEADVWIDLREAGAPLANENSWASVTSAETSARIAADALATNKPDIALAIHTADCMPIALSVGGGVGAIHAGWRSLAAGVIENTVRTVTRMTSGTALSERRAVIGPCIGPCCMEVGEDVSRRFPEAIVHERFLDLRFEAQRRLISLGVEVDHVNFCTRCDDRFFSYRRDKEKAGRQAMIVQAGRVS